MIYKTLNLHWNLAPCLLFFLCFTHGASARPGPASSDSSAASVLWSCLCYRSRYQGRETVATACRRNSVQCERFAEKVRRGSWRILLERLLS